MKSKRWLGLIISLHLVLGLVYALMTPPFEAPDEGFHTAVIRWLNLGRGLPVQQPGQASDFEQEGSQPPLYYLIGSVLTGWMPTNDWEQVFMRNPRTMNGYAGATHNVNMFRPAPPTASGQTAQLVMVLRVYSLVISCVTVGLTFLLAQQIWKGHPQMEVLTTLATAIVAFNPKALFINASVNNDNLLSALSTAILLLCSHSLNGRPLTLRWQIALGVLLGCAALTKLSGLVIWPVALLVLLRIGFSSPKPFRKKLRSLFSSTGVVFSIATLLSGWWYVRNLILYNEVFGLNTMVAVVGARTPVISVLELIQSEWYGFYLSFWEVFGVFTLLASPWVRWFFHAFTLIALAGLLWLAWRSKARFLLTTWILLAFCALTLVGVIRWTLQTPASQGRLLFGAIAPLSMGLAAGWLAWFGEKGARVGALTLGSALAVVAAVIPVVDIAPQYAPPPALTEALLPAEIKFVRAQLSDGVELIGYTHDEEAKTPSGRVRFTLYWRALAPMLADDTLALVVNGQGATVVSKIDSWPGRGLWPTSFWKPGEIYADTYELPLAADALTPTLLRLRVWLWRASPDDRWPVRTPDGSVSEAVTLTVGRLVAAQTPTATPLIADGSTFEYGLTLLGTDNVAADGAIDFYWQARERIPENYTLFVHLFNAQGEKVAQADGEPLNGDWPTAAWEPGQVFSEWRRLEIPRDLPAGQYSIKVGWYVPLTGVRLTAFKPNGELWPENAVVLQAVWEQKP